MKIDYNYDATTMVVTIMTRILTAGDVEVAGLLVKGEQGKVH